MRCRSALDAQTERSAGHNCWCHQVALYILNSSSCRPRSDPFLVCFGPDKNRSLVPPWRSEVAILIRCPRSEPGFPQLWFSFSSSFITPNRLIELRFPPHGGPCYDRASCRVSSSTLLSTVRGDSFNSKTSGTLGICPRCASRLTQAYTRGHIPWRNCGRGHCTSQGATRMYVSNTAMMLHAPARICNLVNRKTALKNVRSQQLSHVVNI